MKPSNIWLLCGALFLLISITVLVLTSCNRIHMMQKTQGAAAFQPPPSFTAEPVTEGIPLLCRIGTRRSGGQRNSSGDMNALGI